MSSGYEWMSQLGREIAEAREQKGWNQGDLSRISGVSQPTISNIELGKTKRPKVENLEAIANALGLDISRLKILAGIITPEEGHHLVRIQQILNVVSRLPEEDQAKLVEMIIMLPQLDDRNQDTLIAMARTLLQQQVA